MQNNVQSVERAFMILEILSKYKKGTELRQIVQEAELNKSTVHRILGTMLHMGYVQQDSASGYYKISSKILTLVKNILSGSEIIEIAKPHLTKLRDTIDETVHLVIKEKDHVIYIDKLEPINRILRMHSSVGKRIPMYSTAVGKVMLAHMSYREYSMIWDTITPTIFSSTEFTITEKWVMDKELITIKKQGFALDNEENELGIICFAAPIFNSKDEVIYALSVSVPKVRITDSVKTTYIKTVQHCAEQITIELKQRP